MNTAKGFVNGWHRQTGAWASRLAALAVLLAGACAGADREAPDLSKLLYTYEWFQLRDAVDAGAKPPLLVRGALACIHNDVPRCKKDLERFLESKASKTDMAEAHELLMSMYARAGNFGQALDHERATMRLMEKPLPKDWMSAVGEAFHESPGMSVEAFRPSTIQCAPPVNKLMVPMTVNGKPAEYILDTGADISVVSETEAQRLGLRVSAGSCGRLNESTAGGLDSRCAVAERVNLGGIHLKNVPFVVIPDPNWFDFKLRGAIGVQILLACKSVSWNKEGMLRLGYRTHAPKSQPNLYCDELSLVVRTRYGNRDLAFRLDTGDEYVSEVSPRFAETFPDLIKASGEQSKIQHVGAGGIVNVDTLLLPDLTWEIGGMRVTLPSVPVMPFGKEQHYGLIGYDVIRQGREVSLDFERMTLTLQ